MLHAAPDQSDCQAQRAVCSMRISSAGGDLASKWEFFSAANFSAFLGTGSRWLAAIPSASQRENVAGPRALLLPSAGCGVTRALHGLVGQGSRESQESAPYFGGVCCGDRAGSSLGTGGEGLQRDRVHRQRVVLADPQL